MSELLPDLAPPHLAEQRQSGAVVYSGRLLHVVKDEVSLPDGSRSVREYIVHPGAVMVIPICADGRLLMERQYRYPLSRAMIEFPAGKREAGEDPWVCAQRELREETGQLAAEWALLGQIHPAIAYSTEAIQVFLARALTPCEQALDPGEFLDVLHVSPEELITASLDGTITDAKTLAGLAWLQHWWEGRLQPAWRALT